MANFEKIIGERPKEIKEIQKINLQLPFSLAEALKISKEESPDIKIALLEYEKSEQDVVIARSNLSPSATLSYEIAEQNNISSTLEERTQQTLKATASWPIYSGGTWGKHLKYNNNLF